MKAMGGVSGPRDQALRARAKAVIPGGMFGHLNMGHMPADYPQFMASGVGARVVDVDGREFVDLMNSWGPVILGHRHPVVEEAAARQAALGDCLNGPSERMVELAERLVGVVSHADWAMFQKNGTDATTLCCTIARAATGHRKIHVAKGAYHGAAPWCRAWRETWPGSWCRRSVTTPASIRSWWIRRSRAVCANSATRPGRH